MIASLVRHRAYREQGCMHGFAWWLVSVQLHFRLGAACP